MKIETCSEFINEARVAKDDIVSDLISMLKSKPTVKMETLADESGIYSLAGMKKYLSDKFGYKNMSIGNALGDLQNDKKSGLEYIYVKVAVMKESLPYWYIGLTKDQAKKLKDKYESEEGEKNKDELVKKATTKKAADAATAGRVEVKKAAAKKAAAKKASGTGVERKAGGPVKRSVRTKK